MSAREGVGVGAGVGHGRGVDEERRFDHAEDVSPEEAEAMYARLQREDPAMAARLHERDVRKVRLSLNILDSTGRPRSAWIRWGEARRVGAGRGGADVTRWHREQEGERGHERCQFDATVLWVDASSEVGVWCGQG